MNNMKNKILSLLVLLAAATGAWAQTQITQGFEDGLGDWTLANCHSNSGVTDFAPHSGTNIFYFYYSTNTPQYLISPEIDAARGGTMSFYYARYSSDYPESFKVGYSTTTNDPTAFTWSDEVTCTNKYDNGYLEYTYDIPAGAKYVAIACTSYDQLYLFIDDIKIDYEESDFEVTTDAENKGDAFTEATFTMPANNVIVKYALARDMEVDVNAEANADSYYVIKRNNVFGYLYPDDVTLTVTDVIDAENPVVMTAGTDYTTTMQKKDEEGEWTDVNQLSVGTFRYAITGKGGYTGTIYSDPIVLKEAYEVEVAANSYATYYQKDALTLETEEEEATIYTIASIEGDKAILSEPIDAAPAETPLLIYNSSDDDQTFYLLSVDEPNLALTVAPEFQGTLRAQDMDGSSDAVDYYVCNKHDFVWVKSDGRIAANRCWIELNYATARALQIVFSGDATGLKAIDNSQFTIDNGDYYDLNGRKVNQPKRKGVYIQNGRKVIVK
jgi:hypothetical protein